MSEASAEVARARELSDLEASVSSAMNAMFLVFQPILDVRGGSTFGHELLLRTSHGTFAGPCELLGAAETTGAVVDLGRRIRRMAARAMAGPRAAAVEPDPHRSAVYDDLHARYRALYDALRPLFV